MFGQVYCTTRLPDAQSEGNLVYVTRKKKEFAELYSPLYRQVKMSFLLGCGIERGERTRNNSLLNWEGGSGGRPPEKFVQYFLFIVSKTNKKRFSGTIPLGLGSLWQVSAPYGNIGSLSGIV